MPKITRVNIGEKVDHLMSRDMLDKDARIKLIRFMEGIEMSVFAANREVIHKKVQNLNQQNFLRLATRVAELRADYLAKALTFAGGAGRPNATELQELRQAREAYEELMRAFEAMERAIERGYTDIAS